MKAGRLFWIQRDGSVVEVPMTKPKIIVGRARDADLHLATAAVSSYHTSVTLEASGTFVEDLRSTNGTRVNGKRIQRWQLKHGDQIEIGTEKLVYFTDASQPPGNFGRAGKTVPTEALAGSVISDAGRSTWPTSTSRSGRSAAQQSAAQTAEAYSSAVDAPTLKRASLEREYVAMPPPSPPLRAYVVILSGSMQGRRFPLTKEVTTLGQEGMQVFQISVRDGDYWAMRSPTSSPPYVNGASAGDRGVRLAHNDVIELGSASIRFELEAV